MPDKIILQPFERSDFSRLINWVQSPEFLIQWSGPFFTYPLDESQLEAYMRTAEADSPPRQIFKAVFAESGEVVGHIELNTIDRRNKSAAVSKVLVGNPELRGQGVGSEMVARLLDLAFNEMGFHRMELRVFDWNTPAVRSYQKLGFTIEGHLRDFRKYGEIYWSSYLMSILETEWRNQKVNQEKVLV